MFDYVLGLILLGLGIKSNPAVLGQHDGEENEVTVTPSTTKAPENENEQEQETPKPTKSESETETPKPTRAKSNEREKDEGTRTLNAADLKKFQEDRKRREANIEKISESREKELEAEFETRKKERLATDSAAKKVLEKKIAAFKDTKVKQKTLALATKFQSVTTNRLSTWQTKLQSLLTLLDKLTANAGALKAQGKDTTTLDTDIGEAQTKVKAALTVVISTTASLPTTFSVSSESSVKTDVQAAVESMKKAIEPVQKAFVEARAAVNKALADVETLTGTETEASQ